VDFRSFYPAHASKTAVLRFATFPDANWYEPFEAENLDWLPRRYFVVCNQFWSHKNHATVFRALEILAARGIRPMIVCTGALVDFRQPEHTERLLQQMHRAGVGAQVMLLGLVPRRLQIEVIRRSLAVVQPSLFEGWSTVVEDARVLGKPTLLSDLAVHKEQNPPGAEFFPGSDADTLATLLADAWANFAPGPNLRAEAQARETAKARIVEVGFDCLRIAKS
jgi:glycosyltransferase involved in cell wall biosynthesis